ncbi:MAG: helix-turn-helix transcriptional regulator [Oscillospiraceae bacterium]|nr:helix-turn-helix transcriptional regulator [Oscillospiraceae bacterium]
MKEDLLSTEQERVNAILGDVFRRRRKELGLRQTDVAEKLGVSQPHYLMWEKGTRNIDFYYAWLICRILDIPLRKIEIELLPDKEVEEICERRQELVGQFVRKLLDTIDEC